MPRGRILTLVLLAGQPGIGITYSVMGLNEGVIDSNDLDIVVLNAIIGLSEDEASESEGYRVLTHFGRPRFRLAMQRQNQLLGDLQYVQYDRSR